MPFVAIKNFLMKRLEFFKVFCDWSPPQFNIRFYASSTFSTLRSSDTQVWIIHMRWTLTMLLLATGSPLTYATWRLSVTRVLGYCKPQQIVWFPPSRPIELQNRSQLLVSLELLPASALMPPKQQHLKLLATRILTHRASTLLTTDQVSVCSKFRRIIERRACLKTHLTLQEF